VALLQGCSTTASRTQLGAHALQRGDYTSAESYMHAALRDGEQPAANWHNLGLLYRIQAAQSPVTHDALLRRSQAAFAMEAQAQARRDASTSAVATLLLAGAAATVAAKGAPTAQFVPASVNCTSVATGSVLHTNCD
jgi:hypothetical protein